jgi:hypothetical protein
METTEENLEEAKNDSYNTKKSKFYVSQLQNRKKNHLTVDIEKSSTLK